MIMISNTPISQIFQRSLVLHRHREPWFWFQDGATTSQSWLRARISTQCSKARSESNYRISLSNPTPVSSRRMNRTALSSQLQCRCSAQISTLNTQSSSRPTATSSKATQFCSCPQGLCPSRTRISCTFEKTPHNKPKDLCHHRKNHFYPFANLFLIQKVKSPETYLCKPRVPLWNPRLVSNG